MQVQTGDDEIISRAIADILVLADRDGWDAKKVLAYALTLFDQKVPTIRIYFRRRTQRRGVNRRGLSEARRLEEADFKRRMNDGAAAKAAAASWKEAEQKRIRELKMRRARIRRAWADRTATSGIKRR